MAASPRDNQSETGKLSTEDRIAIALSEESSRELARQYGVHHSRICTVRAEAQEILRKEWGARRPGRKPKPQTPEEVSELSQELKTIQRDYELSQMRNDWLDLQIKRMARHAAESGEESFFNELQKKAGNTQPTSSL